jgi:hypothetical protein
MSTFTLPRHLLPRTDHVDTVTLAGATHTVAWQGDADTGDVWVTAIKFGDVWHCAADVLAQEFHDALGVQLAAEFKVNAAQMGESA